MPNHGHHDGADDRRGPLHCTVFIASVIAAALVKGIERLFKREPDREWRDYIEAVAAKR